VSKSRFTNIAYGAPVGSKAIAPGTNAGVFAFNGETSWMAVVAGALVGVTMSGAALTDQEEDTVDELP
jgi:hypothetical protein